MHGRVCKGTKYASMSSLARWRAFGGEFLPNRTRSGLKIEAPCRLKLVGLEKGSNARNPWRFTEHHVDDVTDELKWVFNVRTVIASVGVVSPRHSPRASH
jgi:hypothetical protein